MASWLDYGLGYLNYDQMTDRMDEAKDDINTGFDEGLASIDKYYGQARGDVTDSYRWGMSNLNQQANRARGDVYSSYKYGMANARDALNPYRQYGNWGMQGVKGLGEFNFSNQDFYRDPSYQWRLREGLKGVSRQAAAQKMLRSTNTLNSLNTRAQQEASQEYQNAYKRALDSYQTNLGRYDSAVGHGLDASKHLGTLTSDLAKFRGTTLADIQRERMGLGTDLAKYRGATLAELEQNRGDNITDINIGRGGAMADITMAESKAISDIITNLGGDGANPQNYVVDAAGNFVNKVTGEVLDAGWNKLKEWGLDFLGGDSAAGIANYAGTAAGLSGLGGTAGALGSGGLWGTSSGIGASAIGGSSTGANALGINAANFSTFGTSGASTVTAGAPVAGSGITQSVMSALPGLAVAGAFTFLGAKILPKIADKLFGDNRRYTDKTEDELAKSGDPVMAATGLYANAAGNVNWNDPNSIGNMIGYRGVMMDTINNPANTTPVQNEFYANFMWQGVSDIINNTWNGDSDQAAHKLGLMSGTVGDKVYMEDFYDDTGKALRKIYGKNPQTERLNDLLETYSKFTFRNRQEKYAGQYDAQLAAMKAEMQELATVIAGSQPNWDIQVNF
jgi:type II secretory pathway pseudopilin PulG